MLYPSVFAPDMEYTERLELALECLVARRNGRPSIPPADGYIDKNGCWRPSEVEFRECCRRVVAIPHNYPFSIRGHCDTVTHVASLFFVEWRDLIRLWNKVRTRRGLDTDAIKVFNVRRL